MLKLNKLALFVILLIITNACRADCGGGYVRVLPDIGILSANPVLIIQEIDFAISIVTELNNKYPVYLHSGGDTVKLSVVEVLQGQMYVTQALVKPVTPLTPGKTYTLVIQGISDEILYRSNSHTRKKEPVTYRVLSTIDTVAPFATNSTPVEQRKSFTMYGCGPSTNVFFKCVVSDSSAIYVRTTVTNKSTGKQTSGYLLLYSGEIRVGHDMCSGLFTYPDDCDYTLTVSYMDGSGNVTPVSAPVSFTRPSPENSQEE